MRELDDVLLELSKTCLMLGEDEAAAAADVHPSLRNYKFACSSCLHIFCQPWQLSCWLLIPACDSIPKSIPAAVHVWSNSGRERCG